MMISQKLEKLGSQKASCCWRRHIAAVISETESSSSHRLLLQELCRQHAYKFFKQLPHFAGQAVEATFC